MSGSVLQCCWAQILSIWDSFFMNSDGFGHHLFEDFNYFSAGAFAECQRRLARNGITENFKNMQITADICKKQTHYLLLMHFWRPICKPLKPHATTMLATQSADICPQRRWAHPSRNTFGVLCCSKPIFWENAKSCQELPRTKSQRTQTSELQATIC